MFKILVVEDNKELNKTVCSFLNHSGYEATGCLNATEGYDALYANMFDLIVSDIMMPDVDGFEFARNVRELNEDIPILFMTACDDIASKQRGFRIGIDDYMVKPFSFDELLARLRVITRRKPEVRENIYQCGDLVINCNNRSVMRQGKEISLSPKEYAILEYLARNKNVALTRSQIESNIWDLEYDNESNVIDVYIRYLRKKIDDDYEEKLIQTVRGVGYMLKCEK